MLLMLADCRLKYLGFGDQVQTEASAHMKSLDVAKHLADAAAEQKKKEKQQEQGDEEPKKKDRRRHKGADELVDGEDPPCLTNRFPCAEIPTIDDMEGFVAFMVYGVPVLWKARRPPMSKVIAQHGEISEKKQLANAANLLASEWKAFLSSLAEEAAADPAMKKKNKGCNTELQGFRDALSLDSQVQHFLEKEIEEPTTSFDPCLVMERDMLKEYMAEFIAAPEGASQQECWSLFLQGLNTFEQTKTELEADAMQSFCQAWVLYVPAGYLMVEKALVSHNVSYRVASNVIDYNTFKCLEFMKKFFPWSPAVSAGPHGMTRYVTEANNGWKEFVNEEDSSACDERTGGNIQNVKSVCRTLAASAAASLGDAANQPDPGAPDQRQDAENPDGPSPKLKQKKDA
eukprot:s3024_g2.t1